MKLLAEFIMRGRLQAMLVAATTAILSLLFAPLSLISSGTIALVTLRRGAKEGLVILACAGIAAEVLTLFIPVSPMVIPLYMVFIWSPVWLISVVLREGRHISLALEIAVFLGVIGVIGYYLYSSDPTALWKQAMPSMIPSSAPKDKTEQMINLFAPFMTGVAASGTVFGMLLGLFLGRWWQALLYNPGGFKQEFLAIRSQPRVAIACFIVFAIALTEFGKISEIARNISVLLLVLYTVIGTAVLHCVFSRMKIGNLALPMFYITLFLIPQTLLPVAIVGLADTWFNIRKINLKQN